MSGHSDISEPGPPPEGDLELAADRPAELRPEDQKRIATRKRYAKPLAAIAEEIGDRARELELNYSVSAGTLKRWIRIGREIPESEGGPDLPPLDELELVAEWFDRQRDAGRMTWRVPEVFERMRGNQKGARADSEQVAGAEGGGPGELPDPGTPAFERLTAAREKAGGVERGFAAALARCEEAEALAYARWQEELDRTGDDYSAPAEKERRKAHDEAMTKLRQMQSGAGKILEESSEFARWNQVEAEVADRLANLKAGLSSLMSRVGSKIRIPADLFRELCLTYDLELDSVFEVMGSTGFDEPFELTSSDD